MVNCGGASKILRDFSSWTSAHGLPHIGSAQNKYLRTFWTTVTLLCLGMFIYVEYRSVEDYFSYGVSMQTELKFEERVFPAISLCHLNRFKADQIANTPLKTLVNNYKQSIKLEGNGTKEMQLWGYHSGMDTASVQTHTSKWSTMLGAAMNDAQVSAVSYDQKDLIMSCAYNTKPCNDSDNKLTPDPNYGHCYTFNADSVHSSTRAGPLYGLRMLLRTDQAQYLPFIPESGVKVTVHGQEEPSFPDAFGLSAAPGFSTSFGIKFVQTVRLASPYGDCIKERPPNYYYTHLPEYSIEACYRSCLQREIISKCQCFDPLYEAPEGVPSCAPKFSNNTGKEIEKIASKMKCIDTVQEDFNVINRCKHCAQPCKESTYVVTVSTALWPSDVYKPTDCGKPEETEKYWKNSEKCVEWYKTNTLLVELYYERMNYQLMSETEDHTMVGLISDTGGHLGLWLGSSFITCVEFGSLSVLLCLFCASGDKNKAEEQNKDEDEDEESGEGDEEAVYDMDTNVDPTPPPTR